MTGKHKAKYTCPVCGYTTSKRRKFIAHVRLAHRCHSGKGDHRA